jgi:hypothetical protein
MARSRLHGSRRVRRTTVQPVQLSLMPDQVPAPAPALIVELPDQQVAAAVAVLAALIARTVDPSLATDVTEEASGE